MFFNTHTHINDLNIENVEELINNALKNNVNYLCVIGTNIADSIKAIELAHTYSNVYAVCGIHPSELKTFNDDFTLLETLYNDEKTVGIGEIGLDYHYLDSDKEIQLKYFEKFLIQATKYKKPVIIHCRDAYLDTSGNITNASNEIIGKLVEVQDENGNVVSSIQDVNGNPIKIGENTADVINKLKETRNQVDATNGKKANIDVTDNGTASKVQRNIDNISSYKQVIVGVQYTSSGKPYYNGSTMYATGTENAMPGIASVAEYGPELIQSRSGELTFVTTRQLVNMDGGETVYNARQTKEILNSMNKPKISNQESTLLKEISIKLDYLKEIASKEFNKITENIIQQVDVNGVTDLRELIEELTEYTELREL